MPNIRNPHTGQWEWFDQQVLDVANYVKRRAQAIADASRKLHAHEREQYVAEQVFAAMWDDPPSSTDLWLARILTSRVSLLLRH